MRVQVFQPEDLLRIAPQASQLAELNEAQRLELGWQYAEHGSAFTVWDDIGGRPVPVFCGGVVRRWQECPDCLVLWSMFSIHKDGRAVFLTRGTRRFIAMQRARRVEAHVASSNLKALAWARLVGLVEETRLSGAMPDGSDMVFFIRKGAN